MREKNNIIKSLRDQSELLKGKKKKSLEGLGNFVGANNIMRAAMNIKHQAQHLTIDEPEFPYIYDGKENIIGENSSFYKKADKEYKIINIIKKYDELLKGKSFVGLYFLYCKDDDSYKLVERKEVENLVENFGFEYKNDYLDQAEIGEMVPKDTMLYSSTSYIGDNVGVGINGRILYAAHPAVQDDAIIISKSFAKRMVSNQVTLKTIPVNENSVFLNLYGDSENYRGLPNIGDTIQDGILCATRSIKESRMFSDMRDNSLKTINLQSDQVFYGSGKVIDITIYNNNKEIAPNKVNKQILQYYNDTKYFYKKVYKECNNIIKTGSINIDREIYRWKKLAQQYLDTEALYSFNDNIFNNLMVEILVSFKEEIKVGRKIVG